MSVKPRHEILSWSSRFASSSHGLIFCKSVKAKHLSSQTDRSLVYRKHIQYEKLKKASEVYIILWRKRWARISVRGIHALSTE